MVSLSGVYLLGVLLEQGFFLAEDTALLGAMLGLGVGLGGGLMWHARQAWQGRPSRRVVPTRWRFLVGLVMVYGVVLGAGQALLMVTWGRWLFPAFHGLAALLPLLLVLFWVTGRLPETTITWREVFIHLAGGLIVAPMLALTLEAIGGVVALIIFTVGFLFTPGGQASVELWLNRLSDPFWLENPTNLPELLTFAPVPLTLVLVVVVLAPLIEEALKPLSVAMVSYRRATLAQVWVWGLVAGSGFALFENLFNTLMAVDLWAGVMTVRLGATVMHCVACGLIALGWQHWLKTRRVRWLLLGYAVGVLVHALWNGAVVTLSGVGMLLGDMSTLLAGGLSVAVGVFLLGLAGSFVLTLGLVTRRLAVGKV
jgi:hypothetical protein